jgi:hypothetical protein
MLASQLGNEYARVGQSPKLKEELKKIGLKCKNMEYEQL